MLDLSTKLSTCVSDDCHFCSLTIDSHYSDLPELMSIIDVEIDHLYV
jgi:hypothetical protein